ncbi:hypothetical protein, partial [Vibrio cholerae]|uniref:hypothetical protein n=1 Tax=Vibrio cholerae TaxID=666 RepID=UPI001E5A5AD5
TSPAVAFFNPKPIKTQKSKCKLMNPPPLFLHSKSFDYFKIFCMDSQYWQYFKSLVLPPKTSLRHPKMREMRFFPHQTSRTSLKTI